LDENYPYKSIKFSAFPALNLTGNQNSQWRVNMSDWYDEDADWFYDGDVNEDNLYPDGLYWPPVGEDGGTTGWGDAGFYALL
jgi:hypothetical protein